MEKEEEVLADWGLERNDFEEDLYDEDIDITPFIGEKCCKWITEAYSLTANGMPTKSFSLVLDGDPAPDQSSKLFEIVKEDAAWQVALLQRYSEESLDLTFTAIRRGGIFFSKVFPQAIQDIVQGISFVQCKLYFLRVCGPLGSPKRALRHVRGVIALRRNTATC